MSKNKGSNPFTDPEFAENEPMVEPDQPLHEGDENIDLDMDEELDDIETAEEGATGEVHEKLAEAHDQLMRTKAEIENVRRRAERDVANAHKYSIEKFATDLLPTLDSLEQTLTTAKKGDPITEGVELTLKMLLGVMEKYGVEIINPEGEKFDPQLHEAMTMQPADGVEPNTVMAVLQKGYSLNGRLVRPARVMVSK